MVHKKGRVPAPWEAELAGELRGWLLDRGRPAGNWLGLLLDLARRLDAARADRRRDPAPHETLLQVLGSVGRDIEGDWAAAFTRPYRAAERAKLDRMDRAAERESSLPQDAAILDVPAVLRTRRSQLSWLPCYDNVVAHAQHRGESVTLERWLQDRLAGFHDAPASDTRNRATSRRRYPGRKGGRSSVEKEAGRVAVVRNIEQHLSRTGEVPTLRELETLHRIPKASLSEWGIGRYLKYLRKRMREGRPMAEAWRDPESGLQEFSIDSDEADPDEV